MKNINITEMAQGKMKQITLKADKLSEFIEGMQEIMNEHGDMEARSTYDGSQIDAEATIYKFSDNSPLFIYIGVVS